MKKGMTVTYEVEGGLYINITNRCSNRCTFCIRSNGDGAYGSDSLWLVREPTLDEIKEAVFSRDLTKYSEVVFCGYGEPTYRLFDAVTVAKEIKKRYPCLPIRINTNGQSDLIHGCDTSPMYEGAFDAVSISLNTSNAEKYVEICHPVYKKDAFYSLVEFAKNVKKYVQNVSFSVVRQTLTEKEISECEKIAENAGVKLRIRDYIGKES